MSRITANDAKGLMEAYSSIYDKSTIKNNLNENFEDSNFNIDLDPEAIAESVKDYLISEGYVQTEAQAIKTIQNMSEEWLSEIITDILIYETFIDNVNSLVEDGYDLSDYTWDELYESYVDYFNIALNEEIGDVIGQGVSNLIGSGVSAGMAGLGWAADRARRAWQDAQRSGTPSSAQPLQARTRRGLIGRRARVTIGRGQSSQQPSSTSQTPQTSQPPQGGPSGGTRGRAGRQPSSTSQTSQTSTPVSQGRSGGGASNQPPQQKPPKIDPLQTVKDIGSGLSKAGKGGKEVFRQVFGQPARGRFFGTTRTGQVTRGSLTGLGSAADIIGKLRDPSGTTKSTVARLGSYGPTVVGGAIQGLGYVGGGANPTGGWSGIPRSFYQGGEALRGLGSRMWDQPTSRSQPSRPSTPQQSRATPPPLRFRY